MVHIHTACTLDDYPAQVICFEAPYWPICCRHYFRRFYDECSPLWVVLVRWLGGAYLFYSLVLVFLSLSCCRRSARLGILTAKVTFTSSLDGFPNPCTTEILVSIGGIASLWASLRSFYILTHALPLAIQSMHRWTILKSSLSAYFPRTEIYWRAVEE